MGKFKWLLIGAVALMSACNSNSEKKAKESGNQQSETAPQTSSTPGDTGDPTIPESDKSTEELLEDARRYVRAENYREARFAVQRVMRRDSSISEAYEIYGDIYFAINNTEEAKNQWKHCRKIDPDNVECRLSLGQLWITLKLYKKALKPLNEVIEIDPGNARGYFYKGLVYRSGLKDTNTALQYFQKAVDLDQDYIEALDILAVTLAARGDSLAPFYYQRILDIQPNNSDIYYKLGIYYMERDEYNQALEHYSKATQINPDHADAFYNMGYMMIQLDNMRAAKDYFTKSIAAEKMNYKSYYGRGFTYESLGDINNARKDYKKTLEIMPNHGPAREGLRRINQ